MSGTGRCNDSLEARGLAVNMHLNSPPRPFALFRRSRRLQMPAAAGKVCRCSRWTRPGSRSCPERRTAGRTGRRKHRHVSRPPPPLLYLPTLPAACGKLLVGSVRGQPVNLNASAYRDANAAGVPGRVQLAAVAARAAVCSCLAPVPIDRHTLQHVNTAARRSDASLRGHV